MNKVSTANRRGFLKKSLYSAPVVLALGHLAPSMVHGADSGFVDKPQEAAVATLAAVESGTVAAAAQPNSPSTGNDQTDTTTDVIGGSNATGEAQSGTSDNNQTK